MTSLEQVSSFIFRKQLENTIKVLRSGVAVLERKCRAGSVDTSYQLSEVWAARHPSLMRNMDMSEYHSYTTPTPYVEGGGGGYQPPHHYVPSSQSPFLSDTCPPQHQHVHHQQGFSSQQSQQQQFVAQQFEADYSGEKWRQKVGF